MNRKGGVQGEVEGRGTQHKALEAHRTLVMSVIDEAITNIDNVDHVLQVCVGCE